MIGKLILGVVLFFAASQVVKAADLMCEKQAKDYQKNHGGTIVFIQPLKPNGAYDLGHYNGHFINKAYSKTCGTYYYDVQSKSVFHTVEEIKDWYQWTTGKDSRVFHLQEGETPPFPMIWHY